MKHPSAAAAAPRPPAWGAVAVVALCLAAGAAAQTTAEPPPSPAPPAASEPAAASGLPPLLPTACPPEGHDTAALQALRSQRWALPDDEGRDALARALWACLGASDATLRETLALDALASWMRAGALRAATARWLADRALPALAEPQAADGLRAPAAAVVLAEVVRADRARALWTPAERAAVFEGALRFLRDNRDRRGYVEGQGWRAASARGADLLAQLALHPALDRAALDRVLDAVAQQALPEGHFHVFGEGERLARPVAAVALRGLHGTDEWAQWLGRLATAAAPEGSGSGASGTAATGAAGPDSLAALARRHNAKALLLPLHAALALNGDGALRARLEPGLKAALGQLR